MLLDRLTQLAIATESTIGTAETLVDGDVIGNVFEPKMTPKIEMVDRPETGSFQHDEASVGLQGATCTFRTDWIPKADGTSPSWLELLGPAVGFTQSTDTFTGVSEAPGTNAKTVTIGLYENGRRKLMTGAVGNAVFILESGKPVQVEWTFEGVWGGVTDTAMLSPTLSNEKPIRFAASTTTVGSWAPCFQLIRIDLGNVMVLRECQTKSAGYISGAIVDRKPMLSANPEAALVASKDIYGEWLAMTESAFSSVFADANDTVTITGSVQPVDIQDASRQGIKVDDLSAQFNDESLTIAISATP